MKRKIILHGRLKKLCPSGLEFDAATVAEAINALCLMTNAFNPIPGQQRHQMRVRGYSTREDLYRPLRDDEVDIHLHPDFSGSKQAGMIQIVIGVVLVAVAVMMPATVPLWGAGAEAVSLSASSVLMAGVGMMGAGVLAALSPAPQMDTPTWNNSGSAMNPDASKYLGAPKNTSKSGTRIPIGYGRHRLYGQVLSINIDAKDVAV